MRAEGRPSEGFRNHGEDLAKVAELIRGEGGPISTRAELPSVGAGPGMSWTCPCLGRCRGSKQDMWSWTSSSPVNCREKKRAHRTGFISSFPIY